MSDRDLHLVPELPPNNDIKVSTDSERYFLEGRIN